MTDLYMVFDVESNGLYGHGFAVGWVVRQGERTLADGIAVASMPRWTLPEWVLENVLPALPPPTHGSVRAVRDKFWSIWQEWQEKGAVLAADVPWPVEARFLAQCVDDNRAARERYGPYPLIDIASIRLAAGLDPLAEEARLANETPAHNPLADARQSARLLVEALAQKARGDVVEE